MKVIEKLRNAGGADTPKGRETQDWARAMRGDAHGSAADRFLADVATKLAADQPLSNEQLAELATRSRTGDLSEIQVREAEHVVRAFNVQLASAHAKQKALDSLGDLKDLKDDIAVLETRLKLLQAKRQAIEAKQMGLQGAIRELQKMQLQRPDLLPANFDAERAVRGMSNDALSVGGALSLQPMLA